MEQKKVVDAPADGEGDEARNATETKATKGHTTRTTEAPVSTGASAGSSVTLPVTTPTIQLGKRTFAVEIGIGKNDAVMATVREVAAETSGLAVIGWRSVYGRLFIRERVDDLRSFASDLAARLARRKY